MKIVVCLGNVPDTTTKVKFSDGAAFDKTGVQWIINPWDELALTRAMELKEDAGNLVSSVSVVTVGGKDVEPTMRKALAIGADDAMRVDAEATDAYAVAAQLAEAIKDKGFDIILSGIESSDYNGSMVGGMLAEMLDIPSVSAVSGLNLSGSDVDITRDIDGGKEQVSVSTPFVAIVQKGIAKEARIAAMRGIMMARKKPLAVVPAAEVESLTEFVEFELPAPKPPCKMVDADNVAELVDLLQNEAKVL
ncbi:MAG: electron transfer flavoprotein subunit beta/FixA family protein [Prolixibacteraceae bacterium]|jgi:electron transfer flavoprotein beta subunit|nr:electron transfer flavoprotein subunit beta/FixA family protein [Prolixibacteraceae bacterium]MBT6005265.1 electron transfer flavoprotein subunit beta/FixA family protein [Prolixibacteraceae bacterium]MBT6767171.1 electron transfer flavoprotein subunit beta/FixA family protein [Prolixibacteraceae bacterium]MBT6998850.1 electron transfer flavoprotein subunit beta/FixA family protein [Prolixibacteraceae bacterium]MBT7395105.1 electron transfer flavoprotein subunit beta/FixA family protein [Pro